MHNKQSNNRCFRGRDCLESGPPRELSNQFPRKGVSLMSKLFALFACLFALCGLAQAEKVAVPAGKTVWGIATGAGKDPLAVCKANGYKGLEDCGRIKAGTLITLDV